MHEESEVKALELKLLSLESQLCDEKNNNNNNKKLFEEELDAKNEQLQLLKQQCSRLSKELKDAVCQLDEELSANLNTIVCDGEGVFGDGEGVFDGDGNDVPNEVLNFPQSVRFQWKRYTEKLLDPKQHIIPPEVSVSDDVLKDSLKTVTNVVRHASGINTFIVGEGCHVLSEDHYAFLIRTLNERYPIIHKQERDETTSEKQNAIKKLKLRLFRKLRYIKIPLNSNSCLF
jgi:hypothetical protein